MDIDALLQARELVWIYVALPLLAVTAAIAAIRLRAVQWRRLNDGARALAKSESPTQTHWLTAGMATTLSAVGSVGAAGAIGAATAVSLGGAGVLPYVWAFGFLLAGVRYAEVWLARTDAPGGGDAAASGSLSRRLVRMGAGYRVVGWTLALLIAATGFAFAGITQGAGLFDAAERLMPGQASTVLIATAVAAGLLVAAGRQTATIAGWCGVAAIAVLVVAAGWSMANNLGAAFGALAGSFQAAFDGPPQAGEFTGAFAGEVAFAAALYALPAPAAFTGVAGGLHSMSAGGTRRQVAAALLGPFIFAAVTTLLVMAYVGSGAFGERIAGERVAMPDIVVYRIPAETASQRAEESRLYDGYIRIPDGKPRNPTLNFATARGMMRDVSFEYHQGLANIALHIKDGKAFRVLQSSDTGALVEVPPQQLHQVIATGEALPRGASLVLASADKGGGEVATKIMLAALLALAIVALVAWGHGVSRSIPGGLHPAGKILFGLLPAAGLAVAAFSPGGVLPILGSVFAGITASLAAIIIAIRLGEVASLDG